MHAVLKKENRVGVRLFTRPIALTGWGRLPSRDYKVTIEIDVDKLMEGLGNKALGNKSKRSRQFGVLVIVQSAAADD